MPTAVVRDAADGRTLEGRSEFGGEDVSGDKVVRLEARGPDRSIDVMLAAVTLYYRAPPSQPGNAPAPQPGPAPSVHWIDTTTREQSPPSHSLADAGAPSVAVRLLGADEPVERLVRLLGALFKCTDVGPVTGGTGVMVHVDQKPVESS